jgi:hypothetical protein
MQTPTPAAGEEKETGQSANLEVRSTNIGCLSILVIVIEIFFFSQIHEPAGEENEIDRIVYDIVEEFKGSTLRRKIKQTITKISLRGGTDSVQEGKLFEVLNAFYEIVGELYEKYISDIAKEGDYAQMILYTDAMDHPVSTPVRLAKDLTVDHLLTKIKEAQNSGVTIKFSDKLIVEFVHIRRSDGWKDEDEEEILLAGGGTSSRNNLRLLYFDCQLRKQSIIEIANTKDNTCLGMALVIGKARAAFDKVKTDLPRNQKSTNEVRMEKNFRSLYQRQETNKMLKAKVKQLFKKADWKIGKPCDIHILQKFESVLGICVKIVSLKHQLDFIYKGNKEFEENTVYLCYSENRKTKIGHYDLIVNIKGFFSKMYYCKVCDVGYTNVWDHKCKDVQDWCYACYDRFCKNSKNKKACPLCSIQIRSVKCEKRHRLMNCMKDWKCQKCRLKYPRNKKENQFQTDGEMELNHVCYTYMCWECNFPVPEDHLCFVKKKKLKAKLQKFCFFDFETDQSSGEHVVNYIHARYFVPDKSEVDLMQDDDEYASNHNLWKGGWFDIIFKGEDALKGFLAELIAKGKKFDGYTIIAHNLRGFDGVFILKELVKNNICPNVIVKGQKIMNMTIPGCNIRFIDSFNFLPMGLAKLPAAFGLSCGSKGYFPHFFNCAENWVDTDRPLPDISFYGVDSMNVNERNKFLVWYKEEKGRNKTFNMEKEIAEYCKQDVNILMKCCLAYRELMCKETGCDPFSYLTCASVCNAVYRANFMPENTIARVPPAGYSSMRYSEESLEWLEYLRRFGGFPKIRHAGNSVKGEKKIGKFFADGFDEDSKTVFEYYGCFFHGCEKCFPKAGQDVRNPVTKKMLKQSLKETREREVELLKMGYTVISIWGCEWKVEKRNAEIAEKVKKLDVQKPLNPRDAFFGGRTECFKLSCDETPIAYEDITSLYPWVNFTKKYPVGHPEILMHLIEDVDEYFGFIQCKILPPRDLYIPVLPVHVGRVKKLVFPLCNKCANDFQIEKCSHDEDERVLQGTWFSEEIKLAISKGYTLKKIYCVWNFKETTENLFTDYVKTFYKKKLLSSKLPFSDSKEIEEYMKDVEVREKIKISGIGEFKENPGLRQLTKLMLNNLWGRFGMQENLSKSVFITRFEQFVKLLDDEAIDVQGVRVVSDTVAQVMYRAKSSEFLEMSKDTNIYIAVTTTAWARIRLYEEMDKVQERVLYCDTDSVIYKKVEDESWNLTLGNFLGDMTDELDEDDWIVDFVSGGPKNYAYRTHKGKTVVKVKGFTLDSVNAPIFSFENIKKVIINGLMTVNDEDRVVIPSSEIQKFQKELERRNLAKAHSDKINCASAFVGGKTISTYKPTRIVRTRDWRIMKRPEQKLYSFCFDKRIILSNFSTVPFGYIGSAG